MNKLQYEKYNQLERRLDKMFQSYFIHKNMLVWNYDRAHIIWCDTMTVSKSCQIDLNSRLRTVATCKKKIIDIVKEMCELADMEFEVSYVLDVINEYKTKVEFNQYRRCGL